ncbi:hypothetical protein GR160_03040 [Flavobacterium sp. Sd200]|uniref:hypothetical protein n=1 Tax=Flavobacterium sp. Sd200 TaxID=2692211 RepID=UPI00136CF05E|nr:hypothetical protein [Flavobacterium sp. Sd200]MXN90190.1 hypothetical protein [Flavobacterium sp. Sd200]
MKKITLLFILFSTIAFAQSDRDLSDRTFGIYYGIERNIKKTPDFNPAEYYANGKIKGIKDVVDFTEEQKAQLKKLFTDQYPVFYETAKKYYETKTAQSKVEIMKLLVKNEEDFRAVLTREQLATYIGFKNGLRHDGYFPLKQNFIEEEKLVKFKKELQ